MSTLSEVLDVTIVFGLLVGLCVCALHRFWTIQVNKEIEVRKKGRND